MKTRTLILISFFLLSLIFPLAYEAQAANQKVLLYIRTGSSTYDVDNRITQEVGVMISMLEEAGVLEGKKYAHLSYAHFLNDSFKAAIYGGRGVIRDGSIITSSHCPNADSVYGGEDGTSELTILFVEAIKEQSQ